MTSQRIWAEPLTDNERSIMAQTVERGDVREITRWLNHLLKCYDALLEQTQGTRQ